MEAVKAFNAELSSLYEGRPPISKAKMTAITRTAIKAIKFYKHVVQSVEKFIQKCKSEYKVPGLYVIDSIVRQSRHQFSAEKDVFAPRFARNIQQTFMHLFNCPPDDKGKIVRVLNLWQKNQVFTPDVVQPLLDLASKDQLSTPSNGVQSKTPPSSSVPAKPDPSWLAAASELNNSAANKALQNLQTLLLEKKDSPGVQAKKDEVKFDKKLLDFDYDDDEDDPSSPQQSQSNSQPQPLPSIDSLHTILSNPEVLRQLQNLQHQMSSRQQQAEMEDKMRRLQEMRHQEEEFDKHLAQTLPNLPFAAECDFKPSSVLSSAPSQLPEPAPMSMPPMIVHPTSSTAPVFQSGVTGGFRPVMEPTNMDLGQGDYDERSRLIRGVQPDINVVMGGGSGGGINDVEIIDLISGGDSTGRSSRSPSRSTGRRRDRRSSSPRRSRRSRSRSGSRSRSRRPRRSRSRDRDRDKEDREKEKERRRRGLPLPRKNHISVCSTTLWVGHLSKLVQQEELSDTFGEFGDIISINLIPPRGCAFVVMNRRQDAFKALQQLKQYKLQGKAITLAWAPSKGMKDKEWKDYWEVEEGASFIPWYKLSAATDFRALEEGGMIDEDTMPDWLKSVRRDQERSENFKQQQVQQMAGLQQMSQHQPQQQIMKEPKDDNMQIDQNKRGGGGGGGLGDNMSALPPPSGVPGFLPMSEASLGPPPSNQPPPMAPSMVIPPFAMPPNVAGLLGPMGPMGHLGMGNVPLAVPPPMMMPPQGIRLPFNQQIGLMGPPIGPGGPGPDKGPKNNEGYQPGPMVPPFGLPMGPIPTGPNVPLNNMGTKGPTEMDVEEPEDMPNESKENNLNNGQRSLFGSQPPQFGPPHQMQGPSPFINDNGPNRDMDLRQSQLGDMGLGDKQKHDARDLSGRRGRDDRDERDRDRDRDRDRRFRDNNDDDGPKRRRRDSPGRGGPPGPPPGKDMDRRGGRNRGDWGGPKGRPKWDQMDDRPRSSISPFRDLQGFGPGHDGPSPMKDQRPPLLPLPDQHFSGRQGFGGPPGPQGPPRGGFGPLMNDDDDDRRLPPDFHHGGPPDFHHGGGGGNPPDFMGPPDFHPDFHGGPLSDFPDFHEFRGGEPPGFQDGPPDFGGDFPPRMFFGRGPPSQRGMGPRGGGVGGPRNSNGPFGPPRGPPGPPGHMGMRGPPPRQGPGMRMGPPGGPGPRGFMPMRLRGGPRFQAGRRWDDFPLSPGGPPERERLPFERPDSRPLPPFQQHNRDWDKGMGGGGDRGGRALPQSPRRPREDRKSRWSSAGEKPESSSDEPTESGEPETLSSTEPVETEAPSELSEREAPFETTQGDQENENTSSDYHQSEYREDTSEPYQPEMSEMTGEHESAEPEAAPPVEISDEITAERAPEESVANECGDGGNSPGDGD